MKSSLSQLSAAFVAAPLLLASTTAFAQGAPAAGAPAAPPPGAPPVVAPPPDQVAPAAPPPEEAPKPLFWRGTSFTWTNSATTTMFGLGSDLRGSEEESYGMDFVLSPNFYLLDLPNDKITATLQAGVTVELTDSGTTTYEREPQFRDTQVGVGYTRNIFTSEDKEWSTKGSVRLRYSIPTSKFSLLQGRYGVLSPSVSLSQVVRLLGNSAIGLNNLTVSAGFTYSHLFSRATTPTNGGLERTRTNPSFDAIESDQLGTRSFDIDRVIPSVTFTLPLIKDLTLVTAFRLIGRFKAKPTEVDCIEIMGGCGELQETEEAPTYFTDSTFDIALSQPIYDVLAINIGYNNETLTLGEDGKTRNIFYSPYASFYLDLSVNIDAIYEKASGRSKMDLPPGPRGSTVASAFGQPAF